MKSKDRPNIMGVSPAIVVIVVRRTGLILASAVLTIASSLGIYCEYSEYVSIKTILLLTTIPAKATIPVPVIMMEKVWSITSIPIKTPDVERTTASNTNTEL